MRFILVGRPNVGKSTLFNSLARRRRSVISEAAGTTRDWSQASVVFHNTKQDSSLSLTLIDTPGYRASLKDDALQGRLNERLDDAFQAHDAQGDSAVFVLWMIDGKEALSSDDQELARYVRKKGVNVLVLVNKSEGKTLLSSADVYELGFGDPLWISAKHGVGLDKLEFFLSQFASQDVPTPLEQSVSDENFQPTVGVFEERFLEEMSEGVLRGGALKGGPTGGREASPCRVALLGCINAGKSSLINALLGQERLLVGEERALTRDYIEVPLTLKGRPYIFIDTPGIKRGAKMKDLLEHSSFRASLHALRFAHIALIVVDVTHPYDVQNRAIAKRLLDEGRAIVVVFNKIDVAPPAERTPRALEACARHLLPQLSSPFFVGLSSKSGEGISALTSILARASCAWEKRISTSALNTWLHEALSHHPPPLDAHHRAINVKYATQVKTRPPHFTLFTSSQVLGATYKKYLIRHFSKFFGLGGTPVRLSVKRASPKTRSKKSHTKDAARDAGFRDKEPRDKGRG